MRGETWTGAETRLNRIGCCNSQWPFPIVSRVSNTLKPSLPISPHDHPQFTIAVHLACSPTRIVLNRSTSNSLSLFANWASQACSSDCATFNFDELSPKIREDDEPVPLIRASRVGFCCFEALISRVTLHPRKPGNSMRIPRPCTSVKRDNDANVKGWKGAHKISLSRMMFPTCDSNSLSLLN
jgi:hypothetical protein